MKHVYFVQFSNESMDEHNQKLLDYYKRAYYRNFGYEAPRFFLEIPTWIPIMSGIIGTDDVEQHLVIIEPKDGYIPYFEECSTVFLSATSANYKNVFGLVRNMHYTVDVYIGGYVSEEQKVELEEYGATWLDSPQQLDAFEDDVNVQANPDYRLFKDWPAIPRLTLSYGCEHNCRFCNIDRRVTARTWSEIKADAMSFMPLKFKYIYIDDKTFGQAQNWTLIDPVAREVRTYNKEFEGFIVQTTAQQVIDHKGSWTWNKHVKFVEIGVETLSPEWLGWMRKPHSVQQINKAMAVCMANDIKVIPNLLTCFPGKGYGAEVEWLRRWKDTIAFVNLFRLCCYENSKGADDWFVYSEQNADETTFNRSWMTREDVTASQLFELDVMSAFARRRFGLFTPAGQVLGPFDNFNAAVAAWNEKYPDFPMDNGGFIKIVREDKTK